ncbi:MAG: hypothetical protein JST30_17060 [Armatimonadetes bacterium]|nr:hypothetical protein [Armatimonadota bacterium]
MHFLVRGSLVAVLCVVAVSESDAFIMIDDLTGGDYTTTITHGVDFHFVDGLDKAHTAWGNRQTMLDVVANPRDTPITLSVGGGQMKTTIPPGTGGMSTRLRLDWGLGNHPLDMDFSKETEIWVDLKVENPDGRFASIWSVRAINADGTSGSNGGWLWRPGGIRFKLSGFTGHLDWSAVRYLSFTTDFDPPGYPESYKVTRIYAVPEPHTAVLALLGFSTVILHRRKHGDGR